MLSFSFTPFPVLHTHRLVLRQPTEKDVPELFFLRSDAACMEYMDRDPMKRHDDALAFIKAGNEGVAKAESISWAITAPGDDTMTGSIAFWRIDKENHRAELGYMLHPSYQGKGLMSEALAAVLDYGFRIMRLHSVEANTNPHNLPSQKLLERHGFRREAMFREDYYFNGKFIDSAIYSLLTSFG